MKLAIIYWQMVGQVGGIATHLNALRRAAIEAGDECDILVSGPRSSQKPGLFPERKAVKGKDNWIWADGLLPHHPKNIKDSIRYLESKYDAVVFGYPCPTETKAYPEPLFLPVYDVSKPKIMYVMDGYWDTYAAWADPLLGKVRAVFVPQESYALPVRARTGKAIPVIISPFPFHPMTGPREKKTATPSLIWPNQWKGIKGIKQFVPQIPAITDMGVSVDLYSCGIEYYQMRQSDTWKRAVGKDLFGGFDGKGKATYHGNVELPVVWKAMQRAWFTVNLQGMTSKKETYKRGSYNNTEMEALWYGACPILHSSTLQTDLPRECYYTVDTVEQVKDMVAIGNKTKWPINPKRQEMAREFVRKKHLAADRYEDLRAAFKGRPTQRYIG